MFVTLVERKIEKKSENKYIKFAAIHKLGDQKIEISFIFKIMRLIKFPNK